jgi:hypothetical protein
MSALTPEQDRLYDTLARIFDRPDIEIWSPAGHLNQDLSEQAGDIITDDNPAVGRGKNDLLPLTLKTKFTTAEAAAVFLEGIKADLKQHGFSIAAELPRLSEGFSALAEGVVARQVHNGVQRRDEIQITISELPALTQ